VDRWKDITNLINAFRNFAKAPKNREPLQFRQEFTPIEVKNEYDVYETQQMLWLGIYTSVYFTKNKRAATSLMLSPCTPWRLSRRVYFGTAPLILSLGTRWR
jgi:hypothetical protein